MGSRSGKPVLKTEDLEAFSKSSGLSEHEVKETFENFISKHPNGKMKPKDFGEIMSTALPTKDANKMTQHAFRIYDLNNDGFVDFAEFMVVFFILAEGDPAEVLTKIFRLFDVNGDGSISRKELSRLVKDMYGLLKTDNPLYLPDSNFNFNFKVYFRTNNTVTSNATNTIYRTYQLLTIFICIWLKD